MMSLVSAYQKTKEGTWVKEPRISGPGWFVCWDDGDPIELVVHDDVAAEEIIGYLSENGWDVQIGTQHQSGVPRMFANKFRLAKAYWLEPLGLPPEKLLRGDVFQERPRKQGVYYE